MMEATSRAEPDSDATAQVLKDNFLRISSIPRESGHEEKIADFFVGVAKGNDLYCLKDEYNNVLINKKGTVNSQPIALQAHLDMVCVKVQDSKHDFSRDGIEVIVDGDRITADGTSLGADQGVGLAMMLSLLEDNIIEHPDLEFLFTVEEETTFKGAETFPYSRVESKRLINLDNSRDDTVVVGADGDACNEYRFKGQLVQTALPSYKVMIGGFPGGNSGEDVKLSKNNAITTIASILKGQEILVRSIDGGTFENDIATHCEALISTNLDVHALFKGYNVKIEKVDNGFCFSRKDTQKIINEILGLQCGCITDLTSANLGLIKTCQNEIVIRYLFRSMSSAKLKKFNQASGSLKNGFKVNKVYTDPIWKREPASELLDVYKEVYFDEYATYPEEVISHGSLECAVLKEKISGLDIISLGGTIEKYHTTEEITYISSWIKVYKLLLQLLRTLAQKRQ